MVHTYTCIKCCKESSLYLFLLRRIFKFVSYFYFFFCLVSTKQVDECKTMLENCMSILILLGLTQICTGNFNRDVIDTSPLMLMASQETETSKMQFPFKVWQNPRKSAFKPRKRDLHEPKLLLLMGDDYDHKWMRKNREKQTINVRIFF